MAIWRGESTTRPFPPGDAMQKMREEIARLGEQVSEIENRQSQQRRRDALLTKLAMYGVPPRP